MREMRGDDLPMQIPAISKCQVIGDATQHIAAVEDGAPEKTVLEKSNTPQTLRRTDAETVHAQPHADRLGMPWVRVYAVRSKTKCGAAGW